MFLSRIFLKNHQSLSYLSIVGTKYLTFTLKGDHSFRGFSPWAAGSKRRTAWQPNRESRKRVMERKVLWTALDTPFKCLPPGPLCDLLPATRPYLLIAHLATNSPNGLAHLVSVLGIQLPSKAPSLNTRVFCKTFQI